VGHIDPDVRTNLEKKLGASVQFTGQVSHQQALTFMHQATVMFMALPRTATSKYILTGKLFEYLASGKPILLIGATDGKAAQIIREAHAGEVFDYEDINGIKDFLIEQYEAIGDYPSDKAYIGQFSRKELTHKLAKLI
jgi:glycosyltransferase involved in cell wall biosynthesis